MFNESYWDKQIKFYATLNQKKSFLVLALGRLWQCMKIEICLDLVG